MANYATLKSAIEQVIKTNGNNEITGALLQQSLLAMINSLGAGYQFVGIATPTTNPGTPDYNVFYIAGQPGTYSNFGGLVVNDGEIAILKYNGTWTKDVTGAATAVQVGPYFSQLYLNVANNSIMGSLSLPAGNYAIVTNYSSIALKINASPYSDVIRTTKDVPGEFVLASDTNLVLQSFAGGANKDIDVKIYLVDSIAYKYVRMAYFGERDALKNNDEKRIIDTKANLLADYKINLLEGLTPISGYIYSRGKGDVEASQNGLIYPEIPVKAGVPIYFKNIYAYVSGVRANDGRWEPFTSDSSINYSGTFTPSFDGFARITLNSWHPNPSLLTTDASFYQEESVSSSAKIKDNVEIPQVAAVANAVVAVDEKIDSLISVNTNLLQGLTPIAGHYYNHSNGNVQDSSTTLYFTDNIPVKAGKPLYFKNIYAYVCGILYNDNTWAALSEDTAINVSGTFTPTKDGLAKISISTYHPNPALLTTSKDMYDSGEYNSYTVVNFDTGAPKIFNVGSTRDYTTLRAGVAEAIKHPRSIVYVDAETFDLTQEFATEIAAAGETQYGIKLENDVHIIFAPGCIVNALYQGVVQNVVKYFAPFYTGNGGGGFTLENLVIFAKNTRYCVHDEYSGADVRTRNRYINCEMHYDGTTSPYNYYQNCIGGGTAKHSLVEIRNCFFDSVGTMTERGIVSWHNANTAGAQSRIIMSNCYFKNGTFRLGYYGPSTLISEAFINNCSFTQSPYIRAENETATIENWEMTEFLNEIRN